MRLSALQIMRQAALELGLTAPAEVTASLENTGQQLLALLNSAGNDLVVAYTWEELNHTHTFSSEVAVSGYTLPDNFGYMVDQTFWNSSETEEVKGPVNPQAWQRITAGGMALPTSEIYRIQQGAVHLFPVPSAVENYTYQFISEGWVQDWTVLTTYKSLIDNDADVPLLDANLLVKALKVKMWNAKGLDTTLLVTEFSQLFEMLTGKSKGAQVLSLSPHRGGSNLIGNSNVPDGGWG